MSATHKGAIGHVVSAPAGTQFMPCRVGAPELPTERNTNAMKTAALLLIFAATANGNKVGTWSIDE